MLPGSALTEIQTHITASLCTSVPCRPDRAGQQREQKLIDLYPRTKPRFTHAMSNMEVNKRNIILALSEKKKKPQPNNNKNPPHVWWI